MVESKFCDNDSFIVMLKEIILGLFYVIDFKFELEDIENYNVNLIISKI